MPPLLDNARLKLLCCAAEYISSCKIPHACTSHATYTFVVNTPTEQKFILRDYDTHKLVLPSSIPSTFQEFKIYFEFQECLKGKFVEFFTWSSVEEVQDKPTLKVLITTYEDFKKKNNDMFTCVLMWFTRNHWWLKVVVFFKKNKLLELFKIVNDRLKL